MNHDHSVGRLRHSSLTTILPSDDAQPCQLKMQKYIKPSTVRFLMSADCLFLSKILKTISERSLHVIPLSE